MATGVAGPGFVTVYDCAADAPGTSNLNFAAGQTIANSALVDFTGDSICLFSNTTVDIVVDLVGTFDIRAEPPRRIVDTRIDLNDTRIDAEHVQLRPGVPFDLALRDIPNQDAVLNVVATNASQAGWLSFDTCPDQSIDPNHRTSSLNFGPGDTVANLVVVGGSTCVTASTEVDIVIDDVASPPAVPDIFDDFDAWPTSSWTPGEGRRILDTRIAFDALGTPVERAAAGSVTQLFSPRGLAGRSRVAIVNITAVLPDGDGFITAYGCDDAGGPPPLTSSMNYGVGDVVAHTTFVALEPFEAICLYTKAATDIVVDDMGEIASEVGLTLRFDDPEDCGRLDELTADGSVPGPYDFTDTFDVDDPANSPAGELDGRHRLSIVGGSSPYEVEVRGPDQWTLEIVDEPQAFVGITWGAGAVESGDYPLSITVTDADGESVQATTSIRVNPGMTLPCT